MKFTKEEISLCKQVAEKYRKEINIGDCYVGVNDNRPVLAFGNVSLKSLIPLWQIHDCLEFLREKGYRVSLDEDLTMIEPFKTKCYGHKSKRARYAYGDTYLEACLKAVLAVLGEKE